VTDFLEAFAKVWPVLVGAAPLAFVFMKWAKALEARVESTDKFGGEFTRTHVDTQLELNQQILLSLQQLNERHTSTDGRLRRVEDKVFPTA
jgi:hypothetical protein